MAKFAGVMVSAYQEYSSGTDCWKRKEGRTVRTDGCVIFLCVSGMASVSVNMKKTVFRSGDLCILTSDLHFYVSSVSKCFSVRYISLPEEVIDVPYYKIANTSLWDYLRMFPVLRLSERHKSLAGDWLTQAEWILEGGNDASRFSMICNTLLNLFMGIDMVLSEENIAASLAPKNSAWSLISRFFSLMVKHAGREHEVRFYADALNITPDYLYKVCRRVFGMSPKLMIAQQLLIEIKTCLTDTHMTLKEIAVSLNFEDVSYMCRFFRRMTGMTTKEFKCLSGL